MGKPNKIETKKNSQGDSYNIEYYDDHVIVREPDGSVSKVGVPKSHEYAKIKKYLTWDDNRQAWRNELPDDVSYEDKELVTKVLTNSNFKGVIQSQNSRIENSGNKDYKHFYSGLKPQDFEEKYLRKAIGDDKVNTMSEIERRKEYFNQLGVTGVSEEDLKNPKKLYNDDAFIKNYYTKIKEKLPKSEFRKSPMGDDNMFGIEHYDALGQITAPTSTYQTNSKSDGIVVSDPLQQARKKPTGPWWLQDQVNMVGALTDKVNQYDPVLNLIDLAKTDYVTKDPTRLLAANQEQQARFQNQLENTTSGQVANSTILGSTGESFNNAANSLSQIESQNVDIVNNAMNTNTQLENQERLGNVNALDQYAQRMALSNQQHDNSLNAKKWRQIAAFNKGTENWFKKKQMEQVLFPQIHIDSTTGDTEFSGNGRNPFGPDLYQNPMLGGSRSNPGSIIDNSSSIYKQAYDRHSKSGIDDATAKTLATKDLDYYYRSLSPSSTGRDNNVNSYMQNMLPTYNTLPDGN